MNYYKYCEDAALKVKVEGMQPEHSFFKPDYFLEYGTGTMREPVLRDQIVDMPIDEFIGLAEPIPADDEKRHAPQEQFLKEVKEGKKTNWEIPYLTIARNEDEIWKVVGHDGRHRAMLLKALGYKEMPVHIRIPDSSLLQSEEPKELWCQNDKGVKRERNSYPFPPITGENYNKPYCEVEGLKELRIGEPKIAKDEFKDAEDYPSKAPAPCVRAKKIYEQYEIADPRENVYRKDFKIPFSTYMEFVARGRSK